MKFLRNFCWLWHLSGLVMIFKSSGAAVLNTDNNNSQTNSPTLNSRTAKKINFSPCETGISIKCIKMEIAQYIDQLSEKEQIHLLPGLEIVKDNTAAVISPIELAAEMAQKYPNDSSSRLNAYLISKLTNYMQSHHLRLKLIDEKAITEARSISESARSKHKKGGGLEAVLAAGLAMKGTLMALALGAVALLAGKALTAALMALMLAGAAGLKGMDGGKTVHYEIISKPIHSSSHKHHDDHEGHSAAYAAYGRSFQLEKPIN